MKKQLSSSLGFLRFIQNTIVFGVMLAMLPLTGCEKELDLNLGEAGGKPVLYTFIQPDSSVAVGLSKSVSILSVREYELFTDASIEFRLNGSYLSRVAFPNGKLTGSFPSIKFMPGDTVSVDAYLGDDKLTGATTVVPTVVPIEKVDTVRVLRKQTDGRYLFVMKTTVRFTDMPNKADFYQLQLFHHTTSQSGASVTDNIDYLKEDRVFYDPEVGVSSFESIDFQGLFPDEVINGTSYGLVIYLPVAYFQKNDANVQNRLVYRLYHVDELYYGFLRARIIALSNQDLPVFNDVKMPSNVLNGYGVVTSLSPHDYEIVIQ